MDKKIIFFSIDRLGDYLIRSSTIYEISKKFKYSEIICSDKNYNLIKTQTFFNKITLFNTNKKFFNKLKFIINFFLSKYDTVISFDGKNISLILLFLIRARYKYIFIYKKKKDSWFFNFFCKFLKKCGIYYFILNNRDLIETGIKEHYPSKYKNLKKNFGVFDDKTYYLQDLQHSNNIPLKEKFILIHLDEKFEDIINISQDFSNILNLLSNKINYQIILTTFNNNHNYYKNLNLKKIPFKNVKIYNLSEIDLFILEDVPLKNFYELIKKSSLNISCHAGFLVHASLLNNKQTIDILNEKDEKWLNTWITKNDSYKIIYKSNKNEKITIKEIFNNLVIRINEL